MNSLLSHFRAAKPQEMIRANILDHQRNLVVAVEAECAARNRVEHLRDAIQRLEELSTQFEAR